MYYSVGQLKIAIRHGWDDYIVTVLISTYIRCNIPRQSGSTQGYVAYLCIVVTYIMYIRGK